ncbi:MAG TPA: hypothetical protein VH477_12450 [Bryobacteraceae bacterium]
MRTDLAARNRQNVRMSPRSINEAKTQKNGSTGPKTEAGKRRSSQNAFRHGLYSKQILLPHEDPEEFERLQAGLIEEHQPSTLTERLLVEEMAQNYWRIQRYRQLQDAGFEPDNLETWIDGGLFNLLQRALSSAERAFHRTLTALNKMKKQHAAAETKTNPETEPCSAGTLVPETGFVPQNSTAACPESPQTPERALPEEPEFVEKGVSTPRDAG